MKKTGWREETKFSYNPEDMKQLRAIDKKVFGISCKIESGFYIPEHRRDYFVLAEHVEAVRVVLKQENLEFVEKKLESKEIA